MNGNRLKSVFTNNIQIFLHLNGSRNATGIHLGIVFQFFGQIAFDNHIRHAKMTAGFQYPFDFGKRFPFVWHQIQYAIGNHHVKLIIFQRHIFDVAFDEFHILKAEFGIVFTGFLQHGIGKINADHPTGFPHEGSGNKTIVTCSASQIEHTVALVDGRKLGRNAASQSQIGIFMIPFQLAVVFTEYGIIDRRTTPANAAAGSFVLFFRLPGNHCVSVFNNGFDIFFHKN